jgi:hypothetical protein
VSVEDKRLAILQSILDIFGEDGTPQNNKNSDTEQRRCTMRCKVCNNILTDTESVAKDEHGDFLDTCEACLFEDGDPWLEGPEDDWLEPDNFSNLDDLTK